MRDLWTGTLSAIFVAPSAGAAVQTVAAVRAEPGRGLEGDRYWKGEGSFSRWPGARREITLIAAEALAEAEAEFGVSVSAGEHRRNLVVSGAPLSDLVKAEFWVGGVLMRGERVCAPCKYLVRVTGQAAILDALVRRGGLRAAVLSEGVICVGDTVRPA